MIPNGGISPEGIDQGSDGLTLAPLPGQKTVWQRGTSQEVAFAIHCNHGGGYSYRLCRSDVGNVTEDCFQQGALKFESDVSWLRYDENLYKGVDIPKQAINNERLIVGTHPAGSEWKRNPVPACNFCNSLDCSLNDTNDCNADCSGHGVPWCPAGMTQFPEPLPGVSGWVGQFGGNNRTLPMSNSRPGDYLPFSIMDRIVVPSVLPTGQYLLSWRWDCEQSYQVWMNCADVTIVEADSVDIISV